MNIKKKRRQLIISILSFFAIVLGGIIGYMLIEGYSFLEALFMTIITISTVGYGIVKPLSERGVFFTTALIILSLIFLALIIENIASSLLDEEIQHYIKKRRMKRKLEKLHNHVIVCGYGRNGKHTVEELLLQNEKVVIVEQEHQIILDNHLEHIDNLYVVEGDATNEETLITANIKEAKALITTLPADADNVFVVLSAKELNPDILVISRASNDRSESKLRRAGAKYVIMPDSVGGHRMGKLVSQPEVIEFIDYLLIKSGQTVNLEKILVEDLPQSYVNKTLGELNIRHRSGANVIGIKFHDGTYIFNPGADVKLTPKSVLFVLGSPQQVSKLKEILNLK